MGLHAFDDLHLSPPDSRPIELPAGRVLVLGPPEASSRIVAELRARGIEAWSDRLGRVAPDAASFAWADALVVIDPTPQLESEHLLPVTEFAGPTLLAAPGARVDGEIERLLDRGFDFVCGWPESSAVLAALIDRALQRELNAAPLSFYRPAA